MIIGAPTPFALFPACGIRRSPEMCMSITHNAGPCRTRARRKRSAPQSPDRHRVPPAADVTSRPSRLRHEHPEAVTEPSRNRWRIRLLSQATSVAERAGARRWSSRGHPHAAIVLGTLWFCWRCAVRYVALNDSRRANIGAGQPASTPSPGITRIEGALARLPASDQAS